VCQVDGRKAFASRYPEASASGLYHAIKKWRRWLRASALVSPAVCSHSVMPRILRPLFFLTVLTVTATTGSAQWQLQDAHTTADLRGIDNVGSGVAWASGSDGTILRTEDAGIVWQLCAKPPNADHLDFRAIQAFDNSTAIIMSSGKGDLSRLYKTSTDDGRNWRALKPDPKFNDPPDADQHWNALSLPYAVGPHGRIATLRPSAVRRGAK
jgi:hypothetical protein